LLLDYDISFPSDPMFLSPTDTLPNTEETEPQSFVQPTTPNLHINTTIPTALGIDVPLQNGAIGDRFYAAQRAPHGRSQSLTSPSIVMQGDQPFNAPIQQPGQYFDRDFVRRGMDHICLQISEELAQSGLDVDLMTKVSQNYNVQQPPINGRNMTGVVALRVAIASKCQKLGRSPPSEMELLTFLEQSLARVKGGSAPLIHENNIDRPLALEHLLMMLHKYGLRNNEQYNLGIIRPLSSNPLGFGEASSYGVTLDGPKTEGSKTLWLYEEDGSWYPLAQDHYKSFTKSYAEALKMPTRNQAQRPTTPSSSNNGFLHPEHSPSTPRTSSDAGSDATGATSMSCKSCGKSFALQSDLIQHGRIHRSRTHSCPRCLKTFLWEKDLVRHIRTHSGKETRMDFPCLVVGCGKAYTRRDNLQRHHRQDHPNLPPLLPSSVASSHRSHRSRR
jgi:uncharacterized C2H2 Zn-finger protein